MIELPLLKEIFERLRRGYHLSPEDEPFFSTLTAQHEAYAAYFVPLGLNLVRHERDFFYFEPDTTESLPGTLPRIAVFSFILVDHAANQGLPIEEYILGQCFLLSALPHFTLDRYAALLRQVDVSDPSELRQVLVNMERIGWVKWFGDDEFRFLRPFHRVFSKCLEISQQAEAAAAAPPTEN